MSSSPCGLFSLGDLDAAHVWRIVDRACELFREPDVHSRPLAGKVVGVWFTRTSTRTRTAFTVGTVRLGGSPVTFGPGDLQVDTGESLEDTGRILGSMLDALVARTAGPLEELRQLSRVGGLPVVNAMAVEEHPSQALCDLATLALHRRDLAGLRFLYVGEGNNTASALAHALALVPGCEATFVAPPGYGLCDGALATARRRATLHGARLTQVHSTDELPDRVDVVYTTRCQTTGTTKADPAWREVFRPFYVDESFMERWPEAIFMHDLPAHRGDEVAGAVLDGPRSVAWTQAQMKLTSAMAIMESVCRDGG